MTVRRVYALVATLVMMVTMVPGLAAAQGPHRAGGHTSASVALPFTALDVLLLLGGAATLAAGGLLIGLAASRSGRAVGPRRGRRLADEPLRRAVEERPATG